MDKETHGGEKKSWQIAVASSDGVVVNDHFGKAGTFYIYKVDAGEKISLQEKREVTPVCRNGNHEDEKLKENLLLLQDCRYLLVSRIGNGAANMASVLGIEAFEIPGEIEEAIAVLIRYKKINDLFK